MDKIVQSCIYYDRKLNVSDIQSCIPLSKPAISQILNSLERKGYIIREIDLRDRRKISVTVTREGSAVLEKTKSCYDQMLNEIVGRFGESDILTFIEYLNRLVDIYEQLTQERHNDKL